MSANLNIHSTDNILNQESGLIWHRLHSEREDICEALHHEPDSNSQAPGRAESESSDAERAGYWHRELLQARLCKIDDALDRLMAGSYGSCSRCGRWIEDTKLAFDPAIAFCIDCWQREQTKH